MIIHYILFITVTIIITVAAAETLRKHGLVLLGQYFRHHPDLAHSVNNLLVTGFYLVNLGAAGQVLQFVRGPAYDGPAIFEHGATQYGVVFCLLAATWLVNVYFLTRFRCFLITPPKTRSAKARTGQRDLEMLQTVLGRCGNWIVEALAGSEEELKKHEISIATPLPMTPLIAQAAAQLRAAAPPELAQADFSGFVQNLGAKMLQARALNALRPRDQFIASPVLWNEMVYALYKLQAETDLHSVLACHYQSGEETRRQLLPVIGVVVYEELLAKL